MQPICFLHRLLGPILQPFAGVQLYMSLCGLELRDSWTIASGNAFTIVQKLVSCSSEFLDVVELGRQLMVRCEGESEGARERYAALPNAWEDGK